MAITTLRPDASSAASYTVTPSGTAHGVLADDSDSTYIRRTSTTSSASATVQFATASIPSGAIVRQVRLRARASTPEDGSYLAFRLGTQANGYTYYGSSYNRKNVRALATYEAPWYATPPGGGTWDQSRIDAVRVQVTDYADTGAKRGYVYELFVDVDISERPTVAVTTPTGTVASTSRPTAEWTYSDTDFQPQTYYEVRVFSEAQYGSVTFDVDVDTPLWQSGVVYANLNFATIDTLLPNGNYRVYVRAAKTVNGGPFWSSWDSNDFAIDVESPPSAQVTAFHEVEEGRVSIVVSLATLDVDAYEAIVGVVDKYEFALERSLDNATWEPVRDASALIPNSSYIAALLDYEAPRGGNVYYRAQTVTTIGGDVYSSEWGGTSVVVANDGKWWFKPVTAPDLSIGGVNVLTDPAQNLVESLGVFRPLGRSSALVVSAGVNGTDGSYKVVTRTAFEWTLLLRILTHVGVVYIEDPFGGSQYVRFTERSWVRKGTVGAPMRDVSVSYVESAG